MILEKVNRWLEENLPNENTKRTYFYSLREFFKFVGMSDKEYLRQVNTDRLTKDLKAFIEANLHRPPKTLNIMVSAVRCFFADHGISIDDSEWKKIKRRFLPPAKELTIDTAGKHDEWRRILSHMDIKGRSLFLFLLSTGCRIGETLNLKVSDLNLDADPPRAYIRPTYTKGGYGGRTVFMSYEARDAIKEWLKVKEKTLKRVSPQLSPQVWDNDIVWPMNAINAWKILNDALKKTGLDERDPITNRYRIHIHSTRKFFRSNCGLDDALVHVLMGHEGYLDRSYLRTDPDKAAREYKSIAMPRLTIFERPILDKTEMIKAFARSLGIENIDIKIARMLEENPSLDEEQAIGRLIRQELAIKQTKQRKLITEEELPRYLEEGWEIEHVLNTKIVVVK